MVNEYSEGMSPVNTVHSVCYNSINIIQAPKIAHSCVRFTVILQKALTATCFGPYWPIIREHNNCIELSCCLHQSGTVNSSNTTSCLKLLCAVLYGARGGTVLLTGMLPVHWNFSST